MRTEFKSTLQGIELRTFIEVKGEWSEHYTTEAQGY